MGMRIYVIGMAVYM